MNKVNLIELQNILKESQILTIFSGMFSQGIIEELGEAIKKHLENEKLSKRNIFNVFSIFIEQTQNIKNYISSKKDSSCYELISNSGIVAIGKDEFGYFIHSGNLIDNIDVENLVQKLDLINELDKDGLKRLYKEELKRDVANGDEGAGLGLVDMARKASHTIQYQVREIDENYSFFTLKVIV